MLCARERTVAAKGLTLDDLARIGKRVDGVYVWWWSEPCPLLRLE
jgi:hypothetical protein